MGPKQGGVHWQICVCDQQMMQSLCAGDALEPPFWIVPNYLSSLSLSLARARSVSLSPHLFPSHVREDGELAETYHRGQDVIDFLHHG